MNIGTVRVLGIATAGIGIGVGASALLDGGDSVDPVRLGLGAGLVAAGVFAATRGTRVPPASTKLLPEAQGFVDSLEGARVLGRQMSADWMSADQTALRAGADSVDAAAKRLAGVHAIPVDIERQVANAVAPMRRVADTIDGAGDNLIGLLMLKKPVATAGLSIEREAGVAADLVRDAAALRVPA